MRRATRKERDGATKRGAGKRSTASAKGWETRRRRAEEERRAAELADEETRAMQASIARDTYRVLALDGDEFRHLGLAAGDLVIARTIVPGCDPFECGARLGSVVVMRSRAQSEILPGIHVRRLSAGDADLIRRGRMQVDAVGVAGARIVPFWAASGPDERGFNRRLTLCPTDFPRAHTR